MTSTEGTITVITEDAQYEFRATRWVVDSAGQLAVTDGAKVAAEFAPTKWIAVYETAAEVAEDTK